MRTETPARTADFAVHSYTCPAIQAQEKRPQRAKETTMKHPSMKALLSGLMLTAVCATAGAAGAYPTQQIQLIVPFGPGSGTDLIARVVSEKLEQQMGVPIVVENREGAGGVIGTTHVTRARPDGYTVVMASNAITIAPHLYASPPYDP